MRENRKRIKDNVNSSKANYGKFQAIVQKRIQEAVNVKREVRKVNAEIKTMKLARRVREKANIEVDFVKQNAEEMDHFPETKEI